MQILTILRLLEQEGKTHREFEVFSSSSQNMGGPRGKHKITYKIQLQ